MIQPMPISNDRSAADDRDASAFRAAISEGVRDALRWHKLRGYPVVQWRDGQVVTVPPEEIVIVEPSQAEPSHSNVASN